MIKKYPIGTPLTFVWRFQTPDNQPLYLNPDKHHLRLWYYSGRGKNEINTFILNSDADGITWTMPTTEQFFAGSYGLVLDVAYEQQPVFHIRYNNAFSLYHRGVDALNAEQTPSPVTINLLSVGEFYYFSPHDGLSAYEVAVKNGYRGTEEEWLNDPVNGIKGTGIQSIKIVGVFDPSPSAQNTYRILLTSGATYDFVVNNGTGVTSVVQESSGTGSDADNIIRVDFSDGTSSRFTIKNGSQGNSGYSGAAEELEVVNNLTDGGATSALSAEQGKVLYDLLSAGCIYKGTAVPTTDPGVVSGKVFYHATTPGTYSNFGDIVIAPGTEAFLVFDGESWQKEEVRPVLVSNSTMQSAIQELYISGYDSSLKMSILTWTGTQLSFRIISNGEIVAAIVNRTVSAYEPVFFESDKDSPIQFSGVIVMNETAVSTSSESGYSILPAASNLMAMPYTTRKLFDVYKDRAAKERSELCVSRFKRPALNPNGAYYNSYISISRRFNAAKDSVLVFGNKDAAAVTNKFFDFFGAYLHDKDEHSGLVYNPADVTSFGASIVAATTTDSILPVVVGAVHNIDGDNLSHWFTGQNHAYGNEAAGVTPTMREVSNTVTVDGVDVPIGASEVRGNVCKIEVVNMVQGFNTCKENGTGREIVKQKITIVADRLKCVIRVEYMALEDIVFYNIPGVGQYAAPNSGRKFRFIGSTSKPGLYDYGAIAVTPSAGDNKINCIQTINGGQSLDIVLHDFGIGNMRYNTTQNNAYATAASKIYTRLTQDNIEIPLSTNDKIGFEFEYQVGDNVF